MPSCRPPLVSVIIFGSQDAICRMRSAIKEQTYQRLEVIELNTEQYLLQNTDDWKKQYHPNIAEWMNSSVTKAQGEYITWLEDGDFIEKDKIEKQVKVAVNENVEIVYSYGCDDVKERNILEELALNGLSKIGLGAFLVKKQAFIEEGGFDESLRFYADYELWGRIIPKHKVQILNEELYFSSISSCTDAESVKEGDRVCSDLLQKNSYEIINNYDEKLDLEKIYQLYLNAKFYKTAILLLIKILQIRKNALQSFAFKYLIEKEILGIENSKKADEVLEEIDGSLNRKEKKRVIFNCRGWMTGGVERVLVNLLPGLANSFEIILISDTSGVGKQFALDKSILHIQIKDQMTIPIQYRIFALTILLKDEVFIGTFNQSVEFLELYSFLKERNIKTIISNHIYFFLPYYSPNMYPVIFKRQEVYRYADAVTWLTRFNASLGKTLSENSIVMPNPNTFEEYSLNYESKKEKKVILCVGRFFDPIKRVDRMLKVFRKISQKDSEAELWLVGRYNMEAHVPAKGDAVQELIKKLNFPNKKRIRWWGEQENLSYFYEHASILMLTSDNEGFPMVLNEAASFGCPAVAFDIPGLEDIIENGKNGYLIPQDDLEKMAECIVYLLSCEEKLRKLQENAVEYAKRFDKKNVVERWKKLIDIVASSLDDSDKRLLMEREFGYSDYENKEFLHKAIPLYEKEIGNLIDTIYEDNREAAEVKQNFNVCCEKNIFRGGDSNTILKRLEDYICNEVLIDKDTMLKKIFEKLPLNDGNTTVGIYGTGKYADKLLKKYETILGKVQAKLIFIDSYKTSLEEKYKGYDIYNIRDISQLPIKTILIASVLYEDSMVKMVKELYGSRYNLYTFRNKL